MAKDAEGERSGAREASLTRDGNPPAHVVGLVLAAGAGARMGGNKALLLVGGEPLARAHARRMREAGVTTVILVTRAETAPLFDAPCDAAAAIEIAVSDAPDQAGSLAVGFRAWLEGGRAGEDAILVVTPVDAVPADARTIAALIAAVRAGAEAATPRLRSGPDESRGGHPVVMRARVLEDRRGGATHDSAGSVPLNARLAALGDRRVRVDVDDPAIRTDLDTPADLASLASGQPLGPDGLPPSRFWKPG